MELVVIHRAEGLGAHSEDLAAAAAAEVGAEAEAEAGPGAKMCTSQYLVHYSSVGVLTSSRLPQKPTPKPNIGVRQKEDEYEKQILSKNPASLLGKMQLGDTMPFRPGYGSRGGPEFTLWTNYVQIIPKLNLELYRYHISVLPNDITGKKLGRLIKLFLETPNVATMKDDIVTDYRQILISRKKLPSMPEPVKIQYQAENEDEPRAGATEYTVELQSTGSLAVSDLVDYINSTDLSRRYSEQEDIIQALNITISHHGKTQSNIVNVGAKKTYDLDNADRQSFLRGLVALRGFFSSVRLATARILVNVNVTHGAFYQGGQLSKLMIEFNGARGDSSLQRFLKMVRVEVGHREKRNKAGKLVPIIKTIYGLATQADGRGQKPEKKGKTSTDQSEDKPPKVKHNGAGPKDVAFWNRGAYVSVFDFFKISG